MAAGHQRYRCEACGRSSTAAPPRGKPPAVLLYGLGNLSQGMIAKLLGVSHAAVYEWSRAAGEAAPAPAAAPEDNLVQTDEMWRFVNGKKNKVWLWRAFDPVARRTLARELGGRDDATCRRLLDKIGIEGNIFLTDEWEGFHRLIPQEQLFTGKDLTFPTERDNGDVRHRLARFRRRSKVASRARHMVDGALKLLCRLRRPENFLPLRDSFLSIFG
jgi:insertion element IS1 protein InsB